MQCIMYYEVGNIDCYDSEGHGMMISAAQEAAYDSAMREYGTPVIWPEVLNYLELEDNV